jgi:uncharacterized protein YggE
MADKVNLNRGSLVVIGAVAGLVAGMLVGPAMAQSPEPGGTNPPEHTLSVTGTGTIKVTPDVADVQLGVQITRDTVKAARDEAATAMSAVIAALRALGIADADIQTSYVNIGPVYDYNSGQRITGYQVSNVVTVRVRDLAKVADVIDGSISAGATTVNSITFDVSNRSVLEQQAREAAVHDARAHADTLAAAAGVTISGVSSISETTMATPWPYPMAKELAGADASTPVLPGTSSVSLSVTIVYLIQ